MKENILRQKLRQLCEDSHYHETEHPETKVCVRTHIIMKEDILRQKLQHLCEDSHYHEGGHP